MFRGIKKIELKIILRFAIDKKILEMEVPLLKVFFRTKDFYHTIITTSFSTYINPVKVMIWAYTL
jgi:hypothetical protein